MALGFQALGLGFLSLGLKIKAFGLGSGFEVLASGLVQFWI